MKYMVDADKWCIFQKLCACLSAIFLISCSITIQSDFKKISVSVLGAKTNVLIF